ncbi:uncharacterized protein [Procambarus clarkii]|uniref:uncharacterized protein n=1 Tax=Procambarus clarkii TaxID=6728 RepID=UPI003743F233
MAWTPIIGPGASLTTSSTTQGTSTISTTRSISTQTPVSPRSQAAHAAATSTPAPNTSTITISADTLADVLSTHINSTTNAPEIVPTTNQRHLSLPQAARRKTKTPTMDVTDSSDEETLVEAPLMHHKYDTYTALHLLMDTTSPNSTI